eukprot:gene6374-12887_t
MPLIIISGHPCCGKSTFANSLLKFLKTKTEGQKECELLNEESLSISKKSGYKDASCEKSTRAALKSAVNRALNPNTFVIIDSLNYIKGFRYELFCISRSQRTQHCVVWVQSEDAVSELWHNAIEPSQTFPKELYYDLKRRFEVPDSRNRWDNPLFQVDVTPKGFLNSTTPEESCPISDLNFKTASIPESSVSETSISDSSRGSSIAPVNTILSNDTSSVNPNSVEDPKPTVFSSWIRKGTKTINSNKAIQAPISSSEASSVTSNMPYFSGTQGSSTSLKINKINELNTPEVVMELIFTHLTTSAAPVPNSSTVPIRHANADLLYQLDYISQIICQQIINHQKEHSLIDGSCLPLTLNEYDRSLVLPRLLAVGELQRHRRQFVKMNSQHPPASSVAVGTAFIDFLLNQLY